MKNPTPGYSEMLVTCARRFSQYMFDAEQEQLTAITSAATPGLLNWVDNQVSGPADGLTLHLFMSCAFFYTFSVNELLFMISNANSKEDVCVLSLASSLIPPLCSSTRPPKVDTILFLQFATGEVNICVAVANFELVSTNLNTVAG